MFSPMSISSCSQALISSIYLGVYNPPFDARTHTAFVRAGSFVHARLRLGKGQRGSNWSRHDRAGIYYFLPHLFFPQLCWINPDTDRVSAIISKHN